MLALELGDEHSERLEPAIGGGLLPQRIVHPGADAGNATLRDGRFGGEDGALDLPDSILRRLDIVVAAVHGQFELPQRRQTDRLLRALDNRYVRVLAHPTGRLIGVREPMRADWVRVVRRARAAGVALELNAQPDRLDADDALARTAREEGALVAVSSDAHSRYDYDFLRYGIGQAPRGGLEPKDVVNTQPLAELRAWLKR